MTTPTISYANIHADGSVVAFSKLEDAIEWPGTDVVQRLKITITGNNVEIEKI